MTPPTLNVTEEVHVINASDSLAISCRYRGLPPGSPRRLQKTEAKRLRGFPELGRLQVLRHGHFLLTQLTPSTAPTPATLHWPRPACNHSSGNRAEVLHRRLVLQCVPRTALSPV